MENVYTGSHAFDVWLDLKTNTRIRCAMWLRDGLPLVYAAIDDVITIAEGSAKFRNLALGLGPTELRELKALVREQLKDEGIGDLKSRQIADSRWLRKAKGVRKIEWVPGIVPKAQD